MNSTFGHDLLPGVEEAHSTVRPNTDLAKAKTTKAAVEAPPTLAEELNRLVALPTPAEQLEQCERALGDTASELGVGTSKVVRCAVHLAFVERHKLWQLPRNAAGEPLHATLTDYCRVFLQSRRVGCSASRISRLLDYGELGLALHDAELPLPHSSEPLRLLVEGELEQPVEFCRALVEQSNGQFPPVEVLEIELAKLKKKKPAAEPPKQSPWTQIALWSRDGAKLARCRADYEKIEAVFKKISELADRRGSSAAKPTPHSKSEEDTD